MKLAINPSLHLVSLACATGIVLNIMGTVKPSISWDPKEAQIRNSVKALMERGAKVLPDIGQWRYDSTNPFWEQFKSVNLTGYRAPVNVPGDTGEEDGPRQGDLTVDLKQKIDVICISYGGDYTRAIVLYHDPVEVPKGHRLPAPVAAKNTSDVPLQHLELGDHLWKPFHNFYLVEVADDARSVVFENRGKEKIDGKYPQQEVPKNELGLAEDVELKLSPRVSGPKIAPEPEQLPSPWQDLPETTEVHEHEWHVSRKDVEYINRRGNKFFHEDANLGDYSGGKGDSKVQGVSVRKLGRRARGLGIRLGDILISLNGKNVKNRAHALREGRIMWRDGVRRFEMGFLRRGKRVTITHYFPNK